MAEITAAMVKELRERTGLGMMECKKALTAAGGDIEAIDDMRAAGAIKAAKKAGNIAAEGSIAVKIAADNKAAVIIEVNSRPTSWPFRTTSRASSPRAWKRLQREGPTPPAGRST